MVGVIMQRVTLDHWWGQSIDSRDSLLWQLSCWSSRSYTPCPDEATCLARMSYCWSECSTDAPSGSAMAAGFLVCSTHDHHWAPGHT